MKKVCILALCVVFALGLFVAGATAKNAPSKYSQYRFVEEPQQMSHPTEVGQSMFQSAAATTTVLCWYQFDTGAGAPTKQGFTEKDVTSQAKIFFHVDGAATTGGCHGFAAVAGSQSMWCGQWVTTDDPYCGWAGAPGYGNNWAQNFGTVTGDVYKITNNSGVARSDLHLEFSILETVNLTIEVNATGCAAPTITNLGGGKWDIVWPGTCFDPGEFIIIKISVTTTTTVFVSAYWTPGNVPLLGTDIVLQTNSVTYTIMWDSEPGYDFTYVQWWDPINKVWVDDPNVNGATGEYTSGPANGDPGGPQTETSTAPIQPSPQMRFHFQADGAWSDEDGLWDTIGAVNLDDLSISGGPIEDFEGEACGALQSSDSKWVASVTPPFGLYSGLVAGSAIVQEDPCGKPLSNMWEFFDNPAVTNYSCGGWPLQGAMAYGPDANGQYMSNEIWSPWIPVSGTGTSFLIQFLTYRDLPLDNLQFYVWSVRTRDTTTGGCPTTWRDNNNVYYGDNKDWLRQSLEIGPYMASSLTDVQIALGAVDMCGVWCGSVGTGACHSHAPLIDQARVVRVGVFGPQWTVRDYHLWQDNFPEEGGISATSYARCDMALDLTLSTNPAILPGDSMHVVVSDPATLAIDATGGRSRRAVYAFVKVTDRFGTDRGYTAAQIQSPDNKSYVNDASGFLRYPYVAAVSPAGWYAYRFDYTVTTPTVA